MERIKFSEAQYELVKDLKDASYKRGIFVGVLYSIASAIGIAVAIKLFLIFYPLIFKYL